MVPQRNTGHKHEDEGNGRGNAAVTPQETGRDSTPTQRDGQRAQGCPEGGLAGERFTNIAEGPPAPAIFKSGSPAGFHRNSHVQVPCETG